MNGSTSMLCEQGDMGLWNTPVTQEDQQLLENAANRSKKAEDGTETDK